LIYLISDTHQKDLKFNFKKEDILIHLGDYDKGEIKGSFKKILIIGNHDNRTDKFDFACDGLLLKNVWFSHEPSERLPKGAYLNICGHLHNNKFSDYGFEKKKFNKVLEPNKLYKFISYEDCHQVIG
jgi:predicted phosphodiesterase